MIKKNDVVTINYALLWDNGSSAHEVLTFVYGQEQVLAQFEKEIEDMNVDDTKSFTIPAALAYPSVDNALIVTRPHNLTAPPMELLGTTISTDVADFQCVGKIIDVTEVNITIDFNPDFVGKDLQCEVTIISIEDRDSSPSQEETQPTSDR